jgi:hypothetical protein
VPLGPEDRALIHGDVGLHNLALDPATDAVNGIFDYDSAAWADRHHDFRYLLFDAEREDMLDSALRFMNPPLVTRSIAIVSGCIMPRAQLAIWLSELVPLQTRSHGLALPESPATVLPRISCTSMEGAGPHGGTR